MKIEIKKGFNYVGSFHRINKNGLMAKQGYRKEVA
jgi:hypothetical protein